MVWHWIMEMLAIRAREVHLTAENAKHKTKHAFGPSKKPDLTRSYEKFGSSNSPC